MSRLELLHEKTFESLARDVSRDAIQVSPGSEVRPHLLDFEGDAWDFEKVYGALYDWSKSYAFDTQHEQYFIHITTGTRGANLLVSPNGSGVFACQVDPDESAGGAQAHGPVTAAL